MKRGSNATEAHKAKISAGLTLAYASGRHTRVWSRKRNPANVVTYSCVVCGAVKKTTVWNFKKRSGNIVRCSPCQTKDNNAKRKAEGNYSHSEQSRKNMRKPHPSMLGNTKGFKKGLIPWNRGLSGVYTTSKRGKNFVDPAYRALRKKVHDCCANMVGRVMRIKNEKKVTKTFDYLGYSKSDFVKHLESKFADGMTWTNWGAWHVDHIKPVNAFVKEGILDVREINKLSNLQPLWKADNFKKAGAHQ